MSWRYDLKERLKKEIELKKSNNINEIQSIVVEVLRSVEDDFKEITFKEKPVVYSNAREDEGVYTLTLNTLKRLNAERVIRCKLSGKSGDEIFVQVAAIVPEVESDLMNIAGITVGDDKPKIIYLENAKKLDISTKEEVFSKASFDQLIKNVFEYGN